MDILTRILARKHEEVIAAKGRLALAELQALAGQAASPRGFAAALRRRVDRQQPAVIAEIKRASPSKGVMRDPYDPIAIAKSYEAAGAACLSVLTDRDFFQGDLEHLRLAKSACSLPILRKDFIVDAYQIFEARHGGADAILLIAAALTDQQMAELAEVARSLGMDVLLEVHDGAELARAAIIQPDLIGINNRNLQTFETRLETTLELLPQVPAGCVLITESGIHTRSDVAKMRANGVHAFLVGEAFMRATDPGEKLADLFFSDENGGAIK